MPLGFEMENRGGDRQRPCPGGTGDNSPTFSISTLGTRARDDRAPKGRLKKACVHQASLRDDGQPFAGTFPMLKTLGYCRASLRDPSGMKNQILVVYCPGRAHSAKQKPR